MLCSEFALVKHSFPEITVIPLKCRCWHCDLCRPARRARLEAEARAGAPTLFITLTSRRRPGRSPSEAARALVRAWRTVRQEYLKRHGKSSLHFLAVFEATKQGWPHLHIVARARWVDQRWLSKRMGALIGSPIVDVRRVKSPGQVAAYVSKYIGKNPHRFEGVKRYWRSIKYLAPAAQVEERDQLEAPIWIMDGRTYTRVINDYLDLGFQVEYTKAKAIITMLSMKDGGRLRW